MNNGSHFIQPFQPSILHQNEHIFIVSWPFPRPFNPHSSSFSSSWQNRHLQRWQEPAPRSPLRLPRSSSSFSSFSPTLAPRSYPPSLRSFSSSSSREAARLPPPTPSPVRRRPPSPLPSSSSCPSFSSSSRPS